MYLQENLTGNHNSILLTIYIKSYGPCYDCALSYSNVYYLSTMLLSQGQHAMSMCPDVILFNLY